MSLIIEVSGIKAYGKHGIYTKEKKEDQLFLIDVYIRLKTSAKLALRKKNGDDINKTINYEWVVERVVSLVEDESFNLVEHLALKLIEILNNEKIKEISITLHKPNTSLNDLTKDISVTVNEKFS
tara:strand:- start:1120 stop:1494 length:375 start_codon:yes stop_codon:yes gene_type:complete